MVGSAEDAVTLGEDQHEAVDYHVRIGLLSYYSSQASSRSILLVTIGVMLTTIGPANLLRLGSFVGSVVMAVFIAALVRTFFRIYYWGALSNAILQVPATEEMRRNLTNQQEVKEGHADAQLKTYVFHTAAVKSLHVKKKHWRWTKKELEPRTAYEIGRIGRSLGRPGLKALVRCCVVGVASSVLLYLYLFCWLHVALSS